MAVLVSLVLHEDDHLLAVNKPPNVNTHAPSPYAGEGVYDWLRHRERRWSRLAIIHRLDKETSGVLVFAKTREANQSLSAQFEGRTARKSYVLITDQPVRKTTADITTDIRRVGSRYASRPSSPGSNRAQTRFAKLPGTVSTGFGNAGGLTLLKAEPVTGRTHQIRVHAADLGFPVLGDTLYGGTAAQRMFLHAAELHIVHPESGKPMSLKAPPGFETHPSRLIREAFTASTNARRWIHGASDQAPGCYLDQLGDFQLWQSESRDPPGEIDTSWVPPAQGVYHKQLLRQIRQSRAPSPRHLQGRTAPPRFTVTENGMNFLLSVDEGYSVGLFLDQRDNRRRWLTGHVAADFPLPGGGANGRTLLNTFAYTCAFSVSAALGGFQTTSLDLSRKYLDWGRSNFEANQLDPDAHDFIYGDTFDWLKRFQKRGRRFDAIILDPPTFSQSKQGGAFRVASDYGRLMRAALGVLSPQGVILACTNAAKLSPESFVGTLRESVETTGRRIAASHYVPQPPDYPISRAEPGYLKTFWMRVETR